jgi:PadR family transcriptional regulator, regulatory protein PadR
MTERFGPDLLRGSLDLMVLSVLGKERAYGYQIQQQLREASGDLVQASAGTLYPVLHRLEAAGLISSSWDESSGRKRKWYELTKPGKARLQVQARQWDEYVAVIQRLLAPLGLEKLPVPSPGGM